MGGVSGLSGLSGLSAFYGNVGIPPLDLVTTAAAAYSTRKLRSGYSGSAIRVRRSSDNTEADIGFNGNHLNTAALLAHCGSGSGFIVTWYDQSGNARNISQATTAAQPRIVNSGILDVSNNVPCLVGNGTTQFLQGNFGVMQASPGATSFTVLSGAAGQVSATHLSENNSASANTLYDLRPSSTNANTPAAIFRNDANAIYLNNSTTGTQVYLNSSLNLVEHVDTTANITYLVNGVQSFNSAYTRSGVSTINRFTLFASGRPTVQAFFTGSISEVICYSSALSAQNRQTLESNIKAYYRTP